jgi:hypothetical protein
MGVAGGWHFYDFLTIEVEVSCLQLGAEAAFGVLMHEAAHVLDWVRHGEISGHRERFAALAAELGLTVKRNTAADVPPGRDERLFLAAREHETGLNDDLRREYGQVISFLGERLESWAELIADWREWSEDDADAYLGGES